MDFASLFGLAWLSIYAVHQVFGGILSIFFYRLERHDALKMQNTYR
jgi:hypothetical protein